MMNARTTAAVLTVSALLALPTTGAMAADDVGPALDPQGTHTVDPYMPPTEVPPSDDVDPTPEPDASGEPAPADGVSEDAGGEIPEEISGDRAGAGDDQPDPPIGSDPIARESFHSCAETFREYFKLMHEAIVMMDLNWFYIGQGYSFDDLQEKIDELLADAGSWAEEVGHACGGPGHGHPLYPGSSDGSEGGPSL